MSHVDEPGAAVAWACGPGEGYAVLGADTALLLPGSARGRVGALWAAVDDGAGADALLDALLAHGLSDLPGFVLVAVDGDAVRVLVRGEGAVSCDTEDGPVGLDGRGAVTWTERRLAGVRSLRAALGGAQAPDPDTARDARLVGPAILRAGRLAHPADPADPRGAAPPITEPEPVAPDPAQPSPVPAPAPSPVPDPETEPEPARTDGAPVARLLLSTGEVVDVDRVVLLGRDPEARPGGDPGQGPGEPRLVRVTSPLQEVSSTHLEVRPGTGADEGVAMATDLGSTNGTVLVGPETTRLDLQPWTPVPLEPGSVLDLGDGLSIQVAAP